MWMSTKQGILLVLIFTVLLVFLGMLVIGADKNETLIKALAGIGLLLLLISSALSSRQKRHQR